MFSFSKSQGYNLKFLSNGLWLNENCLNFDLFEVYIHFIDNCFYCVVNNRERILSKYEDYQ